MNSEFLRFVAFPFTVKCFIVIVLIYLIVILATQIYTWFNANKYRVADKKSKEIEQKYRQIAIDGIEEIVQEGQCYNKAFTDLVLKMKTDKYVKVLFFKMALHVINLHKDTPQGKQKLENLYLYIKNNNLYEYVIQSSKTIGVYNTLIVLGNFRDKRALPVFEKYEKVFKKEHNLYMGYLVMLGYAQMQQFEHLKRVFNEVIDGREISNEKLYISILTSYEGSVENWQEKAFLHESINRKIIALAYFIKTRANQYVENSVTFLEEMLEKPVLSEREEEFAVLLLQYLANFDVQELVGYQARIYMSENSTWINILDEVFLTGGIANYEYN